MTCGVEVETSNVEEEGINTEDNSETIEENAGEIVEVFCFDRPPPDQRPGCTLGV